MLPASVFLTWNVNALHDLATESTLHQHSTLQPTLFLDTTSLAANSGLFCIVVSQIGHANSIPIGHSNPIPIT